MVDSNAMERAVSLWVRMYRGEAPWVSDEVVSMGLAGFVAGEVARMATLEMESRVTGGARAAYLQAAYGPVVDRARVFCEYAAAGGSVALKPYVDRGRVRVDVVQAGQFFPEADAGGEVVGCVFLEQARRGTKVYVRVETHRMEAGGCRITNRAVEDIGTGWRNGRDVPLAIVEDWADLCGDAFVEGVDRPLFAILKMPGANPVDPDSPLGVSAYAKAVDLIREADKQFSRMLWEMESGNRALYVDMRAFMPDETEPGALPFKRFYRTMDVDPANDTLFAEWSPQLRERSQIAALDEILQRVEDACGLARGTLSEAPESASRGARTATELKIMRQRSYATVRDTQKAVEAALRQLLWAMDVWVTVCRLAEPGDWDVMFQFDDSVVTDRSEAFAERARLVEMGVMAPWELRVWYLGESEEVARKKAGETLGDGTLGDAVPQAPCSRDSSLENPFLGDEMEGLQ